MSSEVHATRSAQGYRLVSRYSSLLRDTASTKCCRLASLITIAFPIPCDEPVTSMRALSPSPMCISESLFWKGDDCFDPLRVLAIWGKHVAYSFGKLLESQFSMRKIS